MRSSGFDPAHHYVPSFLFTSSHSSSPAFSAGDARDNNNGYIVDGVDALDPHYMTPSMFPPMDSIQEFKIQTNSYSAEFGHYSVQVNASTRSGANDVHGSLYDYLRNDALRRGQLSTHRNDRTRRPVVVKARG